MIKLFTICLTLAVVMSCEKNSSDDSGDSGSNASTDSIRTLDSIYFVQLSDEFDNAANLSLWQRFNIVGGWPERFLQMDVNQTFAGSLYMKPMTCTWYGDFQAPYLYKRVGGDFVAVARIRTKGVLQDSSSRSYSLSGILARKPRPVTPLTWTAGGENWVFVSNGFGSNPPIPNFETKTTVNSQSTLVLHPADTGWVEIRMTRQGATFAMSRRYSGQNWVDLISYSRADMNIDTLEVGLECYTDWQTVSAYGGNPFSFDTLKVTGGVPDLQVWVDYIHFTRD